MPTEILRLLVVDDDPRNPGLLAASLGALGFDVTMADSALSATQLVERLQPNAVLLDLVLPFRSGATLLADLKANERTADIPVIVVSDYTDVLSDERRSLAAAVIRKPVQPRVLAKMIRNACDVAAVVRTGSASSPPQEWLGSSPDHCR